MDEYVKLKLNHTDTVLVPDGADALLETTVATTTEPTKQVESVEEPAANETIKTKVKKKKLCKLAKKNYLTKHMEEYKLLTLEPAYICGKCGRTAKDKKNLHKPVEL